MVGGCCEHIRLGGPCRHCGHPQHSPRTCEENRVAEKARWDHLFAKIAATVANNPTDPKL